MVVRRCVELFLIISSVGCVSLQDCEYKFAQTLRAHRAYRTSCEDQFGNRMGRHYARGWKKGYVDVLMGGDGQCPAVPPQCYWSHKFQSEAGEAAIEDWYQGYSQGAATAMASGREHFHYVPRSDYFRQCSPSCLSTDYSEYDYGKSVLGIQEKISNVTQARRVPRGRPASDDQISEIMQPDEAQDSASAVESEEEEIENDVIPPLTTSSVEEDAITEQFAVVMQSVDEQDIESPITKTGTSFVSFNPDNDEDEPVSDEEGETPRTLEEVEEAVEPMDGFELPPSPVSSRERDRPRSLLVSSRWVKQTSYVGRTMKVTRMTFFRTAK